MNSIADAKDVTIKHVIYMEPAVWNKIMPIALLKFKKVWPDIFSPLKNKTR